VTRGPPYVGDASRAHPVGRRAGPEPRAEPAAQSAPRRPPRAVRPAPSSPWADGPDEAPAGRAAV